VIDDRGRSRTGTARMGGGTSQYHRPGCHWFEQVVEIDRTELTRRRMSLPVAEPADVLDEVPDVVDPDVPDVVDPELPARAVSRPALVCGILVAVTST